jgi:hypothetical protein
MNESEIIVLTIDVLKLPILITAVLIAAGVRIAERQVRWAALLAVGLVGIYLLILFRAMIPPDFHIFWRAGRDVWGGIDPYSEERFATNPFLNPPTALPLFAVFALLPFRSSFILWTILNLVITILLPAYCIRVISAQGEGARDNRDRLILGKLSRMDLVGLTAALLVSEVVVRNLYAGQLGLFTTLALLAALDFQCKGRPILAGACLALATVKVATMLPFLILFHRKADIPSWISLSVITLGLCLAPGRPTSLPGQIASMARRIEVLSSPGKVNDYSFEGPQNESMIGFDHLFYRLGVRDRGLIRSLQILAVAAAGVWVTWQVWSARLSRGAACSLVALLSIVFLYHRDYDTPILALPLIYCAQRARAETGPARRLLACCAAATYIIFYLTLPVMILLTRKSQGWGVTGHLVQASLLPFATWFVLLIAAGIVIAESLSRRASNPAGDSTISQGPAR